MTEQMLLQQWSHLPESMKQELLTFFEYLVFKYKIQGSKTVKSPIGSKNVQIGDAQAQRVAPKAGFLKGTFVMSDDFDAPLEDFKEYMP